MVRRYRQNIVNAYLQLWREKRIFSYHQQSITNASLAYSRLSAPPAKTMEVAR